MKSFVVRLFALLMVAAIAFSAAAKPKQKPDPLRSALKITTEVLTKQSDDEVIASKIITRVEYPDGKVVTFENEPIPLNVDLWQGFGRITEEDINFDGNLDLLVCLGPNNVFGNFNYDAYLWNPKTKQFELVENFYEIYDPYVDEKKHEIVGTWRLDNDYDTTTYKWRKGKLVKVSTGHFRYDGED